MNVSTCVLGCTWKTEHSFQDSILPFNYVDPRDPAQVTRLSGVFLVPDMSFKGKWRQEGVQQHAGSHRSSNNRVSFQCQAGCFRVHAYDVNLTDL